MRVSTALLLLPALAMADQIPLGDQVKGWFDKAKSFIPGPPSPPVEPATPKVATPHVVYLTKDNWAGEMASGVTTRPHEWMILISGGNKTCWGQCGKAEQAWKESTPLLAADPEAPSLGYINCDEQPVLCSIWAAGPPAVYHFLYPSPTPEDPQPKTPFHVINLNSSSVTAEEILEIHTKKTWQDVKPYEGVFHPFDGLLAQFQLNVPLGYVMWGFSVLPSWMLMIGLSFLSRSFIGRRAGNTGAAPAPARAQGGAAGAR